MDGRFLGLLNPQRARQFADLAGSETRTTIRISEQLLNQVVAAFLPRSGSVREIRVQPHTGNRIDVTVTVNTPALPPIHIGLQIERQPEFPSNPVLILGLSGARDKMRLITPMIANIGVLPPGIRAEADRLYVDIAQVAHEQHQDALLQYAREVQITTEEAGVAVFVAARIP